jgi:hypothetical protein
MTNRLFYRPPAVKPGANDVGYTLQVFRDDGKPTNAYVLTNPDGYPLLTNKGAPIIAPTSYQPDTFDASVHYWDFPNFALNHPLDLQRTYNDVKAGGGPGMVRSFTPVASFALGHAAASKFIPQDFVQQKAGEHNDYWANKAPQPDPNLVKTRDASGHGFGNRNTYTDGLYGNSADSSAMIDEGYASETGNPVRNFSLANPNPVYADVVLPRGRGANLVRHKLIGYTGYAGPNTGQELGAGLSPISNSPPQPLMGLSSTKAGQIGDGGGVGSDFGVGNGVDAIDSQPSVGNRLSPFDRRFGNWSPVPSAGSSIDAAVTSPSVAMRSSTTPAIGPGLRSAANGSTPPVVNENFRYVGRRLADQPRSPIASPSVTDMTPVPSNPPFPPDMQSSFNDRFGNWAATVPDMAPRSPTLSSPLRQQAQPLGIVSGMPTPPWKTSPPPIFDLPGRAGVTSNRSASDDRDSPNAQGTGIPFLDEYIRYLNQTDGA